MCNLVIRRSRMLLAQLLAAFSTHKCKCIALIQRIALNADACLVNGPPFLNFRVASTIIDLCVK